MLQEGLSFYHFPSPKTHLEVTMKMKPRKSPFHHACHLAALCAQPHSPQRLADRRLSADMKENSVEKWGKQWRGTACP